MNLIEMAWNRVGYCGELIYGSFEFRTIKKRMLNRILKFLNIKISVLKWGCQLYMVILDYCRGLRGP
jgi:hypothetical protein